MVESTCRQRDEVEDGDGCSVNGYDVDVEIERERRSLGFLNILKSSCLSLGQLGQPDEPQTEHRSRARALSLLGHLGLTTPTQHPGHPSPYQHLGLKPDLGPHHNHDSVLHIVIVPRCCFPPDPELIILVRTLDLFALVSPYPTMLYYDSSI